MKTKIISITLLVATIIGLVTFIYFFNRIEPNPEGFKLACPKCGTSTLYRKIEDGIMKESCKFCGYTNEYIM